MAHNTTTARHRSSRKDTFDQIILMLILAFTFRTFVVEAFVIPTGSMAPTLKGAHARFVCDNCGYHYDVNYSSRSDGSGDINIGRTAGGEDYEVHCPNCGFYQVAGNPNIYYGDRILVLKYAYLLNPPQRWDVVVFKAPTQPNVYHYSQAYIKRLVGRPGEHIMILDGDIYVANTFSPTDADWKIQEKPDHVQNALWRIVNDIDYAPQGLSPQNHPNDHYSAEDYLPWKTADAAWHYSRDNTGARAFLFSDANASASLHFDPSVGSGRSALTDFLAYDQHVGDRSGQTIMQPVGDLKLSMYYTRNAGTGPLELKLSKDHTFFTAEIEPGSVSLYRSDTATPTQRELLAKAPYAFSAGVPVRVDFLNLDYRVRLQLDGKEILSTTPQQYHPDVAALRARDTQPPLSTVSIDASRQVCALTHLSLWRDVYYTQQSGAGGRILRGGPDNPVTLGDHEYFVLGDNSPLSADGRFWPEEVDLPAEDVHAQAGVVPDRFLLGKAFVVYWPAGYRFLTPNAPDLIPNFGEMRFIH